MPQRFPRIWRLLLMAVALVALGAACSSSSKSNSATSGPAEPASSPATNVRLGYLSNVTHAPAIVAVQNGLFAKQLGQTKLDTKTFNAGPDAIEALFSGAIDAAFVGPNPAIN